MIFLYQLAQARSHNVLHFLVVAMATVRSEHELQFGAAEQVCYTCMHTRHDVRKKLRPNIL